MRKFTGIMKYKESHFRYKIIFMVFIVTVISYADRSILSIAGNNIAADLGINEITMGYIFSSFSWAYVIGQIPGGLLIDKFGTKRVYGGLIILWSLLSLVHGVIGFIPLHFAVLSLLILRFFIGLISAPLFPANSRIVAEWFPMKERGFATATFTSAQYFAAVLFAPLIGWVSYSYGWEYVFILLGGIGIVCAVDWLRNYDQPGKHQRISDGELEFIKRGGASVLGNEKMDSGRENRVGYKRPVLQLLSNRMVVGVYIAQYCSTVITFFFLTWFPVYLITEKQMTVLQVGFISVFPALAAFIGALTGGVFSDTLIRRGYSRTLARKIPIITGMLISMSIISANYMDSIVFVIIIMSFAFFGRGFGGLGWAIISETSPKEVAGLNGALFNTFGNVAGITTPIVIGYILQISGSFNMALLFVGVNAFIAICCYLFVVGEIKEIKIQ